MSRTASLKGSVYSGQTVLVSVDDDGEWPAVIYAPASLSADQVLEVHHVVATAEADGYEGWALPPRGRVRRSRRV